MLNRRICKLFSLLLVFVILLTIFPMYMVSVNNVDETSYILDATDNWVSEMIMPINFNPHDVFDVHRIFGAYYRGYSFMLLQNAKFDYTLHEGISAIFAERHVYLATSIDAIRNAVAPELIVYIEPNYLMPPEHFFDIFGDFYDSEAFFVRPAPHAFTSVSDPMFYDQWNLEITRGPAAWSAEISAEGAVIAVVDTGLNPHADIDDAFILVGWNYVHNNYDTRDESSVSGHGTPAVSIIAASTDNEIGIASLGYRASIVPLRIWAGENDQYHSFAYAQVVYDAVRTHGVDVLFMNLAVEEHIYFMATFRNAITYAIEAGVLVVAAAGSWGGTTIHYPAGFSAVIGVGGFDRDGEHVASPINKTIFISAPGRGIPAATRTGGFTTNFGGSSAAAPYIASLAALAKAQDRGITQSEFADLLRGSARPRSNDERPTNNYHSYSVADTDQLFRTRIEPRTPSRNNYFGYGVIDVGLFIYNLRSRDDTNEERDFFRFDDYLGWARDYVLESVRYGIMHGRYFTTYTRRGDAANLCHGYNSHRNFSPFEPMWRLEFPMALARLNELNGNGLPWVDAGFTDVDHSSRFPFNYSRHVAWAAHADRGIVRGVTEELFYPGRNVMRAEAAAMFQRYAAYLALSCNTAERLNAEIAERIAAAGGSLAFLNAQGFPDTHPEVLHEWAIDYIAWVVGAGIMGGRAYLGEVVLAAGGNINRAEGVAMLARFRRIFLRGTFILEQGENQGGGGQGVNAFNQASFSFGGTASHPTVPAAIEAESVAVGANVLNLLRRIHDGALANGPVRAGYVFRGWYLDSAFTVPVTSETTVTEAPLTLHARWGTEQASRQLSFYLAGSNSFMMPFLITPAFPPIFVPFPVPLEPINIPVGTRIFEHLAQYHPDWWFISNPHSDEYAFAGWYISDPSEEIWIINHVFPGEPVTIDTVMPDEDISITPHWVYTWLMR